MFLPVNYCLKYFQLFYEFGRTESCNGVNFSSKSNESKRSYLNLNLMAIFNSYILYVCTYSNSQFSHIINQMVEKLLIEKFQIKFISILNTKKIFGPYVNNGHIK